MNKNQKTVLHALVEFMRLPPDERERRFRQTVIAIGKGVQLILTLLAAFAERMPAREIPALPEAKKPPSLLARMTELEEKQGDWNRKDWYP